MAVHIARTRVRTAITTTALLLGLIAFGGVVAPSAMATTSSTEASYAQSVLSLLNQERAQVGLAALRWNANLARAAEQHNYQMANHNTLSHQVSGEHSLGYRVSVTGYKWRALGENIGASATLSLAGARSLQQSMFNEGPGGGHYVNIVNRSYVDVGINVQLDVPHRKLWLTVDFGQPL